MHTTDNRSLYKSVEGYQRAQELYEAYLSLITLPYDTHLIETPQGLTHILTAGTAGEIPVVLFHGNSLFGPHMAHQINAVGSQYRIIVPDVIGCMGRSSANRPDRKGTAYGEWVKNFLTSLNVQKAHMIGISNGAWLVLKLAAIAPEMITSAVLMSAGGFVPTSWRLGLSLFPAMTWGALQLREEQSRRFLRLTSPPDYTPSDLSVRAMEIILRDYRREGVPNPLKDEDLKKLNAPTYILMGEFERPFPTEAVIRRAQKHLPHLKKVEILPGVAHGMVSENPQLVNNRLLTWLEECRV